MCLLTIGVLAGCSFLPQGGPKYWELTERPATPDVATAEYELVHINSIVAQETRTDTSLSFSKEFISAAEIKPDRLRPGDTVTIAVWEPIAGIFPSSGGHEVLPHLMLDDRGELYIPYVGTIKANGLEVRQLRTRIEEQLAKQTPSPQVLVAMDGSEGRAVTIQGDIKNSGRFQLTKGVTRLLPLLAIAGGPTGQPEVMEVTVRRGDAVGQIWLDEIYTDPKNDIALEPGDNILLRKKPVTFNAMGVVKKTGPVAAEQRDLSLLKALNLVGSLQDLRADATGVFLFRVEKKSIVEQLAHSKQLDGTPEDRIPSQQVVYLLDMSEGSSLFYAGSFQVRDGDTLYVTNAPADDWRKLLSVVLPTVGLTSSSALTTTTLVGPP